MHIPSRLVLTLAAATALAAGGTATSAYAGAATSHGVAKALSVFPSNALTVRDPSQLTSRRVYLPMPDCAARPTDCNTVTLLNQLDGFDLDPRIALHFATPVDPAAAAAETLIEGGHLRTGVDRVVWDAATNTLYAHPFTQLAPGTTYTLRTGTA